MATLAVPFLLAFGMSVALTLLCRLVARRLGFVEKPREDRWHKQPTALFGGVAIVVSAVTIGLTMHPRLELLELLGCGVAIGAFGFADDVLSLKVSTKLIAQITVASVLLFFGYRLGWSQSMLFDAMLTLFWIVGITNAFNLLDNMDGLCAGTTLVAGAFLLIGLVNDSGITPQASHLSALLGATAGFFVFNIYPASIFMGDTGSLFLGFNIAAVTLLASPQSNGMSGLVSVVVAPVLLLLIPIFDTTFVTAIRLLSGRLPSQGGRDHSSHRLVAIGLSEPRAVATLWFLAAAGGTISLLLQQRDHGMAVSVALIFSLAMIIFGVYLAHIRIYEEGDLVKLKGEAVTPILVNFMYKRRVAEILLDLCLIPLAYYSAYRLRFEGADLPANYPFFIRSLPIVIVAQLLCLYLVGGYRGTWRYFGMMDAVVFAKGVLLGTVAAQMVILYAYRFVSYSRAVFVIEAALLILLLAGTRASFRLVGEFVLRHHTSGRRCVVYGYGNGTSVNTIREAFGSHIPLKIIGFVDDDPLHHRTRVEGYSVLGNFTSLVAMVERDEVDCVVLQSHLVDVDRLQKLEAACRDHQVDLLRLQIHLNRLSSAS
jgi:UDP-GlcNAc:undecaprenyl-phosphate/decaprenyl-phosphate GlcNAc-1-phosphate transferase